MIYTLSELQHELNPEYPLRGYVYGADGMHSGATWLATEAALKSFLDGPVARAIEQHREVRITDGGDMLVMHIEDGRVVFPRA